MDSQWIMDDWMRRKHSHDPTCLFVVHNIEIEGGFGGQNCRLQIVQKIPHEGDVNRARYMPQNQNLIATKTVFGHVNVFDRTKHALNPTTDVCRPDLRLVGQQQEGYGLSWSPMQAGHVLSASEDGTVCYWFVLTLKNFFFRESHT